VCKDVFYQVCDEKSTHDAWIKLQVLYEGSSIIDGGDHIEEMVIVVYSRTKIYIYRRNKMYT
jgi:hypothetical protein